MANPAEMGRDAILLGSKDPDKGSHQSCSYRLIRFVSTRAASGFLHRDIEPIALSPEVNDKTQPRRLSPAFPDEPLSMAQDLR
jgi:hypothetical protein